jgi:hypothetical protein
VLRHGSAHLIGSRRQLLQTPIWKSKPAPFGVVEPIAVCILNVGQRADLRHCCQRLPQTGLTLRSLWCGRAAGTVIVHQHALSDLCKLALKANKLRAMGGRVPRYQPGNDGKNNEGGDHDGFLKIKDRIKSIGQTTKRTAISIWDNGLWPVEPTTAPMNADAAIVSRKRAKPSLCSLENFMLGIFGPVNQYKKDSCLRLFSMG